MGLDTTHDAFSGGYGTFNKFRSIIAKAAGVSYPPHERPLVCSDGDVIIDPSDNLIYVPGTKEDFRNRNPGMAAFLFSNDCEGEFSPKICKQMADEIEAVLPKITFDDREHTYIEIAKRYISGCRLAYSKRQKLRYF